MTTPTEANNAITGRFATEVIAALLPTVVAIYDNDKTDPPENEEWIRFTIIGGGSIQKEFGGATNHETVGVAVAQIFIPMGIGSARAYEIADIIVPLFRAKNTGADGVTFRTPTVKTIGRSGQFWQVNVDMPYFWRAIEPS